MTTDNFAVNELYNYTAPNTTLLDIALIVGNRTMVTPKEAEYVIAQCDSFVALRQQLKKYAESVLRCPRAPHNNPNVTTEQFAYIGFVQDNAAFMKAIAVHENLPQQKEYAIPMTVMDGKGFIVYHLKRIEAEGQVNWICCIHQNEVMLYGDLFSPVTSFKVDLLSESGEEI